MPIDLVIDERDTKPEIGDTNNNSNGSSFCGGPPCVSRGLLDTSGGHSTDSASTPDQVIINKINCFLYIIMNSVTSAIAESESNY